MLTFIHIIGYLLQKLRYYIPGRMLNADLWFKNTWFNGGAYYIETKRELKFEPPCYIQRYATISGIIRAEAMHNSVKKVVEFGCAELKFFCELKSIPAVEKVVFVDIDEGLLRDCCYNIQPNLMDHVRKRETPLTVQIYAGSVDEFDSCLGDTDIVVAIELIEHLYPKTLDRVPYNIFENIRPRVAIITTPNAEFNLAIPNFAGLRHEDHKFEWSRNEFSQWAVGVTKTYPDYSVSFYGIGQGPEGTEHLGCCSQMAVFRLKPNTKFKQPPQQKSNYKLVKEYEFPVDTTTIEDKILSEFNTRLMYLRYTDELKPPIPIKQFLIRIEHLCPNMQTLRQILEANGRKIEGPDDDPVLVLSDEEQSEEENFDQNETPNFENWIDDEDWNEPVLKQQQKT